MKVQSLRAYGAVAAAVSLALLTSACGSDSAAAERRRTGRQELPGGSP
ncbi:hypothetical protein ACFVFI_36750 [Streptomyces sp. NPDC057705]